MDTLRLRLLCLVAGWLVAVRFVSLAPCSPALSRLISEGVGSLLSRAEKAARCLVIVQARLIAARTGSDVDSEQFMGFRGSGGFEDAGSLSDLRQRLEALLALLEDLPRYGLRLLRRTEKRVRCLLRARRTHQIAPCRETPEVLCAWRLADVRIERPPDKCWADPVFKDLPSFTGGRRRRLS